MKKILVLILFLGMVQFVCFSAIPDETDHIVHFSRSKGTVYTLLDQITKKTGLSLFMTVRL